MRARRSELEAEIQAAVAGLAAGYDPAAEVLETVAVRPRKADVEVRRVVLAWDPQGGGR